MRALRFAVGVTGLIALLAMGVGTAGAGSIGWVPTRTRVLIKLGSGPFGPRAHSAVRFVAVRPLAHGRLPDGQTFTIIGERYRSRDRLYFKLAVSINRSGVLPGGGASFNPARAAGVLAVSSITVKLCRHSYAVVFGLLRARSDVILALRSHRTSVLRRASIPAVLHARGVLVYARVGGAPAEVIVQRPDGKRHPLRKFHRVSITLTATGCAAAPTGCRSSPICGASEAPSPNGGSGAPSPNVGSGDNVLSGVAATSASDAWAVGYYAIGAGDQPLIEHWDGTAWRVQPSPALNGLFTAVAAVSANDAWAVGHYSNPGSDAQTLIEHWNGTSWSIVPSPSPGGSANNNDLRGVAAVSANDAWAVGDYRNGANFVPLVEQWNGTVWQVLPSPNLGGSLYDVAAASSSDAWAGGYVNNGTHDMTVLEHWDGTAWQVQTPAQIGEVYGMTTVPGGDTLGVGECGTCKGPETGGSLVEQWNGAGWQVQPSPNHPPQNWGEFFGVAATSSSDAWAVGRYPNYVGTTGPQQTLIEHWNGKGWSITPSPDPGGSGSDNYLYDVAAVSTSDAWAVGTYSNGGVLRTLIEYWTGTAWQEY